jgi:hypothetical protein
MTDEERAAQATKEPARLTIDENRTWTVTYGLDDRQKKSLRFVVDAYNKARAAQASTRNDLKFKTSGRPSAAPARFFCEAFPEAEFVATYKYKPAKARATSTTASQRPARGVCMFTIHSVAVVAVWPSVDVVSGVDA